MCKWILPEQQMPKEGVKVICCGEKGGVYIGEMFIRKGEVEWYSPGKFKPHPIAWMPLPEPYKKVKG